jgi:DnaJ-class molecular chaperone
MSKPKSYERVKCAACDGHGIVASYDMAGYLSPDECRACGGAGTIVRYESGVLASYAGGPLLGRESRK